MKYWCQAYNYLYQEGIPERFIRHVCITESDADIIAESVKQNQPKRILEVGTFIGLSTGVIALAAPENTTLVCVDVNLPISLHRFVGSGDYYTDDTTPALTYVRKLLETLRPNIEFILIEGFFSKPLPIHIMKNLVKHWADACNIHIIGHSIKQFAPFDIIFIDGDHSSEGVESDLLLASQYLTYEGEIIMHDVIENWGESVRKGIQNFLSQKAQYQLCEVGNIGIIKKRRTNK